MSSEKRLMSPYAFERLVPPLNASCVFYGERANRWSSVHTTQKSFSTMPGESPIFADTFEKSTFSSSCVARTMLFMSNLPDL